MAISTDPAPTVTEALTTRITCRDFADTPVEPELLRSILSRALRSPSGGNLQPWKLHVMTGDTLSRFTTLATERTMAGKLEEPTFRAYPSPLWEPQRSWRYKLGEDMYATLGIPRENKMGRLAWLASNAKFFGAPVGIIITGHRKLEMPQFMDIGIFLQSVMLLAREEGLHTAPQGWWRNWTSVADEVLDIPDDEQVMVGLALGHANAAHPVNGLVADRAALQDVAVFHD